MNYKQSKRLSISIITFFSSIILIQLFLKIPFINYIFSPKILQGQYGIFIWILTWVLIFLECSCIPGPYIPIIFFCSNTIMVNNKIFFTLFATSAVFLGRIVAYYIGNKIGDSFFNWSFQDKTFTEQWCKKLNGSTGKWIYAFTVAAPGFPDFVLAIIAGMIKMNFTFYILVNTLCKGIENYLLILFSIYIQGFSKFIYIYFIIIFICLINIGYCQWREKYE